MIQLWQMNSSFELCSQGFQPPTKYGQIIIGGFGIFDKTLWHIGRVRARVRNAVHLNFDGQAVHCGRISEVAVLAFRNVDDGNDHEQT